MREILVMASRTHSRTECWGGGGEERRPLGTGVFGQASLAGNNMASVAFGKPRLSGGKSH